MIDSSADWSLVICVHHLLCTCLRVFISAAAMMLMCERLAQVFLDTIRRTVPEAPAESPPAPPAIAASMPIWPGGAPPSKLDSCGMPYSYVQKLVRNGLTLTAPTFGGDSYQTPAAAIYARYNKTALYAGLERGLQPCTAACNAQYHHLFVCLYVCLYLRVNVSNSQGLDCLWRSSLANPRLNSSANPSTPGSNMTAGCSQAVHTIASTRVLECTFLSHIPP